MVVPYPVIPQDEIGLGRRRGASEFDKFAQMPGLDTSGFKLISAASGAWATPGYIRSPETYAVAYDQTQDGAGQTGATVLAVYHINEAGDPAVDVHVLGNDGSDVTSFSGYGINRVAVSANGGDRVNNADITITHTTSGDTAAFLAAGSGVTEQAIYTAPKNGRAVISDLYLAAGKISGASPKITFQGWIYNEPINGLFRVFNDLLDTDIEGRIPLPDFHLPLSRGDVFYLTASTTVNNTVISDVRFKVNQYDSY